jgi:hypothetical protein
VRKQEEYQVENPVESAPDPSGSTLAPFYGAGLPIGFYPTPAAAVFLEQKQNFLKSNRNFLPETQI